MYDIAASRDRIRDWLEEWGEPCFRCRIECMCFAFGLQEDYMVRFLYFPLSSGMGKYLLQDIVEWVEENRDLSPNNQTFGIHGTAAQYIGKDLG